MNLEPLYEKRIKYHKKWSVLELNKLENLKKTPEDLHSILKSNE